MVPSNPNNPTILKPAWKSLPPKSHFILSALFHLPERQAHCRIFSNLLAFVPSVGVLMFLLAVRSQALAFRNKKKKVCSVLYCGLGDSQLGVFPQTAFVPSPQLSALYSWHVHFVLTGW